MLFHHHEENDCPLPPCCTYRLGTRRCIRQLWQCRPNTGTYFRDRMDSSFAAKQKSSSQFSCSAQKPHTISVPAKLALMHFSSVTRIFSGMKVQCWWHKHGRNKRAEGCCCQRRSSGSTDNSSLYKIPCAEAVNVKQVDLYGPLGPCQTVLVQNDLFVYQCCFGILRYRINMHTLIVDSYY